MTTLTTDIATKATTDIYTITFTTTDKDWYDKVRILCKEAVDKEKAEALQAFLDEVRRISYLQDSIKPKEDHRTCANCEYDWCEHEPCFSCSLQGDYKFWAPKRKDGGE